MSLYTPINGFTKQAIKDHIRREFKGKAINGPYCQYLTQDGKKCAVGMFIPDGHVAQKTCANALALLDRYPELKEKMPLSRLAMHELQTAHDSLLSTQSFMGQLNTLLNWVDTYVADGLPSTDVGAL